MGDGSKIEWTDATWNPLVGCSRCSEGCDHCYAIGVVHRAMSPQHVGLTVKPEGAPTDWTGELRPVPHLLDQPTRWRRPRRIFVNSLSDLFHPEVLKLVHEPTGRPYLAELVAEMVANERHTFQVLTKRPRLMAAVLGSFRFRLDVNAALMARCHPVMPGGMSEPDMPWPRHIWWGTSIEFDKYAWRADHLRAINGLRWISAEPLLGPLPSLDLGGIDWLVAGGESGPGARPMHPEWARQLRDRCHAGVPCDEGEPHGWTNRTEYGTGSEDDAHLGCRGTGVRPVAFHFKQWGDWLPGGQTPTAQPESVVLEAMNRAGYCRVTPEGEVVDVDTRTTSSHMLRRVGKKLAGRELDGRTWDEWPTGHEQLATVG